MTAGIIVLGNGTNQTLTGTPGDDTFAGTSGEENFRTGLGNDDVFAGGGADHITADKGNDTLDGGAGIDILSFSLVNTTSTWTEDPEFGVVLDLTKVKQDLGYWGVKTIYSIESVSATDLADKIYGTAGRNSFSGNGGNDLLDGRGGQDFLYGDAGNDRLLGGTGDDFASGQAGADQITGGSGKDWMAGNELFSFTNDNKADRFIFKSVSESGTSLTTCDHIYGNFNGGGTTGDKIDLSGVFGGTLAFIGSKALATGSSGQVQVKATTNSNEYLVSVDTDTDKNAEMTIIVHSNTALVKGDFIL